MPKLTASLILPRCPHCSVANPSLNHNGNFSTSDHANANLRHWASYICGTCGGVVVATAQGMNQEITAYFPQAKQVSDDIPERPRAFLAQAQESMHAPAGAILLAASAIDSMLKQKGLSEGNLHSRIEKAAADHLITNDMSKWAHAVRLDANGQRHADESISLPSVDDARRCLDFALALAEIMFVLPSRVDRGLKGEG